MCCRFWDPAVLSSTFFNVLTVLSRIDPGNAFRIHVCVDKYTATGDYDDSVEMVQQEHDVWFDLSTQCSLSKFVEEMRTNIIWGRDQQLLVWGVDKDSGTEWKVTTDEQFMEMIEARWDEKEMDVNCEMLDRDKESSRQPRWDAGKANVPNEHSVHSTSGVTAEQANAQANVECTDDACSSPDHTNLDDRGIDWSAYTILQEEELDGDATVLVDEDKIYEAMGFKAADDLVDGGDGPAEIPVPVIPPELQAEMDAAAMLVDDNAEFEPLYFYDRDNPDMSVGQIYPSMPEFRMAVKQHSIVKEFELGTEKSDKKRFRGFCRSGGCQWIIRAKTQIDGSVRV